MEDTAKTAIKPHKRKIFWRVYPFVSSLEYDDSDQGTCYDEDELDDGDDWEEWEDYSEW